MQRGALAALAALPNAGRPATGEAKLRAIVEAAAQGQRPFRRKGR